MKTSSKLSRHRAVQIVEPKMAAVHDAKPTVLELLRTLKPPVHVAALSTAYKQKTGRALKADAGTNVLRFVREQLGDNVVLMGEGNDTFMRLATPSVRAAGWVRDCVRDNGPILASMVGRLYREAHGMPFAEAFPEGVGRFMRAHLSEELAFELQKGQEILVDLKRRGDARSFLRETSKKYRKGSQGEEAGDEDKGSKGSHDSSMQLNACRLSSRGCAAAYRVPSERILVVGEADFSWSASLLQHDGHGGGGAPPGGPRWRRLTCTSYDEHETLVAKYGRPVSEHVSALRAAGASVLHGVDATRLESADGRSDLESADGMGEALRARGPFHVIAFQFPHAGGDAGLAASIDENRRLLREFLHAASSPQMLAHDGEVHVTLVHRYPYTAWLRGIGVGATSTEGSLSAPAAATTGGGGVGIVEAKRACAEAAKAAAKASKAAKEAVAPEEVAAAAAAKEAARAAARAAAKQAKEAAGSDAAAGAAGATGALAYVGAVPFEFGAFGGYRHQATSRVEGGALDVATQCLTHVWVRPAGGARRENAAVAPSHEPAKPTPTRVRGTADGAAETAGIKAVACKEGQKKTKHKRKQAAMEGGCSTKEAPSSARKLEKQGSKKPRRG